MGRTSGLAIGLSVELTCGRGTAGIEVLPVDVGNQTVARSEGGGWLWIIKSRRKAIFSARMA